MTLPLALANLGLIDEYELLVHPRSAGHRPTLFAGLSKPIDLKLVGRKEFASGMVTMRYELRGRWRSAASIPPENAQVRVGTMTGLMPLEPGQCR